MNSIRFFIILCCFLYSTASLAQTFNVSGGLLFKATLTLGNQNAYLKLGTSAFGTLSYNDVAIESGLSFSVYEFTKRHTIKTTGLAYTYDFFALAGIGQNSNLLGSTLSLANTSYLYNPSGKGGFNGIGFGFTRDVLPKTLRSYGLRRGALLMRFSNQQHQFQLTFLNDLKFGWFYGSGTDYGITGSLRLGYTRIHHESLQYLGFGIDLFTPQPDYNRSPRNPINSHDGRKNVWFTLPPYKDLFYGNFYVYGGYQENHLAFTSKIGINSVQSGAHVQNILHDGFGLNPRFPWPVEQKNKFYIESSGHIFYQNLGTNE